MGRQLWLGDIAFEQNTQNSSLDGGRVKLHNEDIQGEINRQDNGIYRVERGIRQKRGKYSHYHRNNLKYGPYDHPTEHFTFNRVLNTIGTPITSSATVDEKTKVKDIQLDTVSVMSNSAESPNGISIERSPLNPSIASIPK